MADKIRLWDSRLWNGLFGEGESGSICIDKKVCPHISIKTYDDRNYDCEYIEPITLHCSICDKDFTYHIMVN